jgi:homoserine O-succinyltransferase
VGEFRLVGLRRVTSLRSAVMVRRGECISLALINNMPDPALEDTELQFFELLDIASGDVPVVVKLYSLTGVPRTERGQQHLNSFYFDFDDLWNSRFDGVIVTGTEPHQPNLRDEPYWDLLTQVFDWAKEQHVVDRVIVPGRACQRASRRRHSPAPVAG